MRTRNVETKSGKILQTSLLIAIPVAVFGATLSLLSLLHTPSATWLQVEAPTDAVAGSALDIRITLGQVPKPSLLVVDLYLLEKGHGTIGGHPSLTPSHPVQSGGTYSFRAEVPEAENLALVELVIYLSPTGDWQMRTHAARSEAVPVKAHGGQAGSPTLRKIQAFVIGSSCDRDVLLRQGGSPPPRTVAHPPVVFRIFLLGLLAAGGLVCLIRSTRLRPVASPGTTRERRFWRRASILLFLGFLWEALRLEQRLSEWGRSVISALGLYYLRQSYQEAAIALLAAAAAVILVVCFGAVLRKRARLCPVLAGIALAGYVGLSLAAALSFHYIDSVKRISLSGVSLVDLTRAACAASVLTLALVAARPRRMRAGRPGPNEDANC